MTDPVSSILTLAFTKSLEVGSSELTKSFTSAAIAKMADLRKAIWSKLRGNARAETALSELEKGSKSNWDRLLIYLQDAMEDDPNFAAQLKGIVFEINQGKLATNSNQTQTNYDGTNFQNNNFQGEKLYQAHEINITNQQI